jgi:argininosuccinate lyase
VRASLDPGARPLAELVADHEALGPAAVALLEPGAAVGRRTTPGGAGPVPVAAQLERFDARLATDRARLRTASGGT